MLPIAAPAATRTWDGGGADRFWTNRFNWVGDLAPVAGDSLVFPPVASAAWNSTNNFPSGTAFDSILITGTNYTIRGNSIRLTGGVSSQCPAGASNTVVLALTLDAAQAFEQLNSSAHLYLPGNIDLNGQVLTLAANGGYLHLGGAITGTGQIRKTGNATVELHGSSANTYAGGFTVLGGSLRLNKSVLNGAITGPLTNAAGTYLVLDQSNQIDNSAPVVLGRNCRFILNNYSDYIGALFLTGASVEPGTGTLSLNGNCTVYASDLTSSIEGILRLNRDPFTFTVNDGAADPDLELAAVVLGGVNVVFTGAGRTTLLSSNEYTGTTTVNGGGLSLYHAQALGSPAAGTVINPGATLFLHGVHVGAEPLTLNAPQPGLALNAQGASSSWSGVVTLGTNVGLYSGGVMTFSNALIGPGGLGLAGLTFEFAGNVTNTYAGETVVACRELRLNHSSSGWAYSIPADLTIGGGAAATNLVRLLRCCQMPNSTRVTVLNNGLFDLNGYTESLGGLTLVGGRVDTGGGLLTLNDDVEILASDRTAEVTGQISVGGLTRIFSVERGEAYPAARFQANLSGNGGVIWQGSSAEPGLRPVVMHYGVSNSYAGLTTITNLRLYVNTPWALGQTNRGTVVWDYGDLTLVGTGITNETLTLQQGGGLEGSSTSVWAGPIVLAGSADISGACSSDLEIRGPISGTGDLRMWSCGVIRFAGSEANTYIGTTRMLVGMLELAKTVANGAIPGPFILGDPWSAVTGEVATNRLLAANQIANTAAVTVHAGSLLDLNGHLDAFGPLTLLGGRADSGPGGILRLLEDVTVGNPDVRSRLEGVVDLWDSSRTFVVSDSVMLDVYANVIGNSQLLKLGGGWMNLRGSNTYSGLTLVGAGVLDAHTPWSLGSTNAGTIVSNNATFYLSTSITNEALTLNGPGTPGRGALQGDTRTNTWAGPITLNADSPIYVFGDGRRLDLLGGIQGPGGLTLDGGGILRLGGNAANTFTGPTRVDFGTLELAKTVFYGAVPGELIIGNGVGGAGADVVRLLAANQIQWTSRVIVTNSGLLDLAGYDESVGSLSGSGQITLGGGRLSVGGNNESTVYGGLISGAGGRLTKNGTGTLALTANNTYSGLTTVGDGTLLIGGGQPASPVQVNVFGTLLSTGTVGHLTNYGLINPGASPGGFFASNLVVKSGAGVLAMEIAGATSDKYDRVSARGVVDVTGGKLWMNVSYPPTEGDQFLLINNLGASPIVGTFTGLAEGALLTTNGLAFRVSYTGGDGNDLVLTFTNTTLRLAGWQITGGNGNGVIDPNECDTLSLILSNASGASITGLSAELRPITPGVAVTCGASPYPNLAAGRTATNQLPFQLSTLPAFICGTNVELLLTVRSASFGAFSFPVTLPSGEAGWGFSFADNNPRAIPDGGSVTSTVNAAFSGPLINVQVSLFISHSYDADLDIFLEAPEGTQVELSTDNGGSGNSYGVSCVGSGVRTWFGDDAPTAITAGSAPFTNYYRPETPFSALRGKAGSAVGGPWKLIVRDDTANGFTGALNCWSLYLFGPACADGGGPCESCPDRTLYGTLGPLNSTHINHLTRNGVASACGAPKTCPLIFLGGARRYEAFTFENGESNACVTVALTADQPLFSAAYADRFDPASLCANYLGDLGVAVSNNATASYAFWVAARSRFVVVVEETAPGSGGNFALDVRGGSCRPVLGIRPAGPGQVALDWTTAALGHQLEGTATLVPSNFLPVGPLPVVIGGRNTVTNDTSLPTRFYRLRKP